MFGDKWGNYIFCEPSQFLNEIDEKFVINKEVESKKEKKLNNNFNFKKSTSTKSNKINPPKGFKKLTKTNRSNNINSSNIIDIVNGARVKHAKFGVGKVIEIEGEDINKKATIFFENTGQKQLLLRFAKLEILN